jgi:hypothetical protein
MNKKVLGNLALVTLVLTVFWLALLIASVATVGTPQTVAQAVAGMRQRPGLHMLTYLNAALVTLAATLFFGGLFLFYRQTAPAASLLGLLFVPVYATLNLVVYLAQVSVAPGLAALYLAPETQATAEILLSQVLQALPSSGAAFFNNLAYAVLGIPSIIFGWLLTQPPLRLRLAGVPLTLNGAACMLGLAGILLGSAFLSNGALLGGVLFLLALAVLAPALLRG